jgi:hypothetical protein
MPVADAGNSVSRWRAGLPAVAAALAAVSVACAVASLPVYAYNASHLGAKVHYLFADDLVVGILYPLVGAFLVRRRPQNAVGWVLVLTSVLGVNALANQYAVAGLLVSPGSLGLDARTGRPGVLAAAVSRRGAAVAPVAAVCQGRGRLLRAAGGGGHGLPDPHRRQP